MTLGYRDIFPDDVVVRNYVVSAQRLYGDRRVHELIETAEWGTTTYHASEQIDYWMIVLAGSPEQHRRARDLLLA